MVYGSASHFCLKRPPKKGPCYHVIEWDEPVSLWRAWKQYFVALAAHGAWCLGHLHTKEISDPHLGDVIADILVVLQTGTIDACVARNLRRVGLEVDQVSENSTKEALEPTKNRPI